MKITVLTLFPEIIKVVLGSSIIGRAQKNKLFELSLVDIRDFATDKHKSVDDKPYGGGVGMIMKVDVVERAIQKARLTKSCRGASATPESDSGFIPRIHPEGQARMSKNTFREKVILLDPKGKSFNQTTARRYSKLDHIILVCGHYEGIDSRIQNFVDQSISIGPYILTGGEIPAMTIIDSVIRLLSGVLSKKEATLDESYSKKVILEYPQYTRPVSYKGFYVPEILLSGDHKKIKLWKDLSRQKRLK